MNNTFRTFFLIAFYQVSTFAQTLGTAGYPLANGRKVSPGNTVYYIDPCKGNDRNTGLKADNAWKSFHRLNQLLLSAGDQVEILSAGKFHESLMLIGSGTAKAPVKVHFTEGSYDFYPDSAFKQAMQISNTNNRPEGLKTIALYILNSKHIVVFGNNAILTLRGKMIETCVDHSENIRITGLGFDYKRPTVSEITVASVGTGYADITVHPDSKYRRR